jgi:Nucleoside-diphosphate-sugar epimerases
MKIIVTGGAGFIGSHITDMLIKEGHDVCIIDSLVHGKRQNINPGAKFYEMDIKDPEISEIFMSEKPDVLIHEAAQISVPKSIENPVYDAEVNIVGTLNLLEAARKSGVKKVIYPASAAIFGEPKYLPVDEAHPLNMMSGYGVTKHTIEHYLSVYNTLYGIKYTVLRYANVYGPRQDSTGEGGVVAIFCEKLIEGIQPYIYGDGGQTRDFVYVKDVARANIMAVNSGENEIFNVCTKTAVSVNDLLSAMNSVRGTDIKAVYKPEREGDIRHSFMTYDKINSAIGWSPEYSLMEGLKETFEYYESQR